MDGANGGVEFDLGGGRWLAVADLRCRVKDLSSAAITPQMGVVSAQVAGTGAPMSWFDLLTSALLIGIICRIVAVVVWEMMQGD
jgi:hypothetical protein